MHREYTKEHSAYLSTAEPHQPGRSFIPSHCSELPVKHSQNILLSPSPAFGELYLQLESGNM